MGSEVSACARWTIRTTFFQSKSEQPFKRISEERSRNIWFQQWVLTVFDCSWNFFFGFFFCSSEAGEGRLVLHILLDLSLILNSKRNEHVLSPAEFALTLSLIVSQTSQM